MSLRTGSGYLVVDSVSTHYDMYIYISNRGHEITTPCGTTVTVKFVFNVSKRVVDHMYHYEVPKSVQIRSKVPNTVLSKM